MSSMALVHSRIGRVFYGTLLPPGEGGIETRASGQGIHDLAALNHHYRAFRIMASGDLDAAVVDADMSPPAVSAFTTDAATIVLPVIDSTADTGLNTSSIS